MNTMKTFRTTHQGFTLIEVMIVVAIIGILSAVAFPSYTAYVQRSHRAEAKNYLQSVAQRLEQNYTLSGRYNATQDGEAVDDDFIENAGFNVVPAGGPARYNISFVQGFPTAAGYRLHPSAHRPTTLVALCC
jgi:type IV pilus assembly protein PilE